MKFEQRILDFLYAFRLKRGRQPSRKLVTKYFPKAGAATLSACLSATAPNGTVRRRRAAVTKPHGLPIPLQGSIVAGFSARTGGAAAPKGKLSLDLTLLGVELRPGAFALQVQGSSMVEAHIHDGDIVLLEPGRPRNGDIVAAMHDGCLLLKRWLVVGKVPFLKAENSSQPGMVHAADKPVCGVLRGLLRFNQPRQESAPRRRASVRYGLPSPGRSGQAAPTSPTSCRKLPARRRNGGR